MQTNTNKVLIYSEGIVAMSVCASNGLTNTEIEANVNLQRPTGIKSLWKISKESFRTGEPNPCLCESDPNRRHYLLNC